MTRAQLKKVREQYKEFSVDKLGDIWKIYRDKKLSPDELQMFDTVRDIYHSKTGKKLTKNSNE